MADWFGDSGFNFPDFNQSFDFGFDPSWQNFDFSQMFPMPDFNFGDFGFGGMPDFNFGNFNSGGTPGDFNFGNFQDPLALPSFGGGGANSALGSVDQAFAPQQGAQSPMFASNFLSPKDTMSDATDPILRLQAQYGGPTPTGNLYSPLDSGNPFQGDPFMGLNDQGLPGASNQYAEPVTGLGGAPFAPGAQPATPGGPMAQQQGLGLGYNAQGQPMSEFEKYMAAQTAKLNQPASTMDTLAKLAAAFGPTALGAAGLGLQSANRPSRNPLEDDLLRARIQSTGMQDTLAKDRLDFEKSNAEAQRQAQMEMQNALLESHKPGGQGNIDALLKGNPQLAALYQALTKQTTGLAGGGDAAFNALIEQVAQVDIAELQRQAQQQIAQAQEMAARQGINPANIIAEVQQRLLQESAKARANARQTLISQLQPGISTFNSIGGLFGNLFQTPSAG
jgi:hypothetical protein